MPLSDIRIVIQWWFFLFVIGLGFLPLASVIFEPFRDRGYAFAKTVGIAVLAYTVFLFGTLHLVPFQRPFVFIFLLLLFAIVYWFFAKQAAKFTKETIVFFVVEEVLFFGGLLFWSYIRGFNPEIHGLEKYMDFGFINSILRSDFFPPRDMWLTPKSINYYYFGHFVTAVLTRLSGIPPYITYNLMLASIFGFCLSGAFSIATNLYRQVKERTFMYYPKLIGAGLLSAMLVTVAGNLHTLYAFFKAYPLENPVPIWTLPFLPFTFPNNYWYPNATRFIHNTIHEFPMYSWTVADLHGHVTDIAFVVLTIALLLSLFLKTETLEHKHHHMLRQRLRLTLWREHAWHIGLIGFLIAVMYMTNAWDGLIYLLLSSFVLFTVSLLATPEMPIWPRIREAIIGSIVPIGVLGVGFIVFSLPFSIHFEPTALVSGIGVLCAPKFLTDMHRVGPFLFEVNHCQRSPFWQLLMLYGFFYFFVLTFLVYLTRVKKILRTDIFVFLLIILGCLLINIPEFIYAKDIYPEHYRANTMFKLVFQSFIMLSLVSGYVITRMLQLYRENIRFVGKVFLSLWVIITWGLLTVVFIYPFLATKSYYNNLTAYQGLDGLAYLKILHPDDYKGVMWLNETIHGQPVILEAQGDSYTDYARISSNTGLPTVLGWTVHEWLWRGSYDVPAPRITDVQTLYESPDLNITKSLIRKYNVQYVYVGDLEREKYPNIIEDKWNTLGIVVYHTGDTKIYRITKA